MYNAYFAREVEPGVWQARQHQESFGGDHESYAMLPGNVPAQAHEGPNAAIRANADAERAYLHDRREGQGSGWEFRFWDPAPIFRRG